MTAKSMEKIETVPVSNADTKNYKLYLGVNSNNYFPQPKTNDLPKHWNMSQNVNMKAIFYRIS